MRAATLKKPTLFNKFEGVLGDRQSDRLSLGTVGDLVSASKRLRELVGIPRGGTVVEEVSFLYADDGGIEHATPIETLLSDPEERISLMGPPLPHWGVRRSYERPDLLNTARGTLGIQNASLRHRQKRTRSKKIWTPRLLGTNDRITRIALPQPLVVLGVRLQLTYEGPLDGPPPSFDK